MCAPCCGGTGSPPAALSLTPASSKLTPTSFNNPSAGAPIPHLTPPPGHDNAWVTRQKGRSIWQRPAGVNWTPEGERGRLSEGRARGVGALSACSPEASAQVSSIYCFWQGCFLVRTEGKEKCTALVHTNTIATGCVLAAAACAEARCN